MELKDIAAISGKGGLFKIIKPTRNGVILESLDEKKGKLIANAQSKISVLKEISIYTTGAEDNIELEKVFFSIYDQVNNNLPVSKSSTEEELKSFFLEVLPEYDEERVYISDIKKVITWYTILIQEYPDFFKKTEKKENKSIEKGEKTSKNKKSDTEKE